MDEAWGAHLYFHPDLPTGALRGGADVVLSSTHKIVGSLTQSAILHLGSGELVDEGLLDRSVTLIESTSPNALLTASLDAARRHAAVDGQELLTETLETLARTRERIREIEGLDVLDERLAGRESVAAWDPLRLSVDVRGTGATGHRIAELMRERDDVILELFSENVIVATFGVGARAGPDAEALVGRAPPRGRGGGGRGPRGAARVRRAAAVGAARALAPRRVPRRAGGHPLRTGPRGASRPSPWPPIRPACRTSCPDERLTAPTLAYIADSLAHGGLVRGASDRSLATIRVVVE